MAHDGIRMMRIEEFEDLLDRHGEDVSAWPDSDRDSGLALLRTSQAARDLVDEARSLRLAFGTDSLPLAAPPDLADRVIANAIQSQAMPRSGGSSRSALILSLCFVAGFALSLIPGTARYSDVQVDLPAVLAGILQ
jgi:hypothetical protein